MNFLSLIAGLGTAGIFLGIVVHYVSQVIYLILIFPLIIGLGLGGFGRSLVKRLHIRSPMLGGVAGLSAGLLATMTTHVFDYRHFESEMVANYGDNLAAMRELAIKLPQFQLQRERFQREGRQELLALLDDVEGDEELRRALQVTSLWSYMDFAAWLGVEIAPPHARDGLNLGRAGTWIYWLVEGAIITWVAYQMMRTAASRPYCLNCHQWKEAEPWETIAAGSQVVESLSKGEARRFPVAGANKEYALAVTAFHCPCCAEKNNMEVVVEKIVAVSGSGNQRRYTLATISFPPEAYSSLVQAYGPG